MTPLTRSGIVLGLGLGGFLDGIVLHQILGWHHMICTTETCQVSTVEALKLQNTQDGFFHLAVWILTATGLAMLFTAAKTGSQSWTGDQLVGSILAGWGVFNFVEGLVDHQILGIHHVLPGSPHQFLYDLAFLGSGVALVLVGFLMRRNGAERTRKRTKYEND